jgi:hypothetical protein
MTIEADSFTDQASPLRRLVRELRGCQDSGSTPNDGHEIARREDSAAPQTKPEEEKRTAKID